MSKQDRAREVVIVSAVRTPIGSFMGQFGGWQPLS